MTQDFASRPSRPPAIAETHAPRAVQGERRVITILFCDVVNSTALASQFDPEEWAEIMNEAFGYMVGPIHEYGGTVARLLGDGLLAFFGAPLAHEDDPQRAILAGLDILSNIRAYGRELRPTYGIDFQVRIGVNTGPVVVGDVGANVALEYTAMGDAINLAARMEQTAMAGTLQISEDTYRLVAPLFDVWDLGPVAVKGKEEPVRAYRVLGMEPEPARLRGIQGVNAPLIGRAREMAVLREALDDLMRGRSRVCFLVGEAGLGKSRLIAELRGEWRRQLREQGAAVQAPRGAWMEFVAVSYGASRPYDMLKRHLRQLCNIRETDPSELVHDRLNRVTSFYPEPLARRMHRVFAFLLGDAEADADFRPEGEAFRRELHAVLLEAAHYQIAQAGSAVYVLDDLHWADPASLDAIRALMTLAESRPSLWVFAMRPDRSAPGWQATADIRQTYSSLCRTLYLTPLSDEDSASLAGRLVADAELPQALVEVILRKAEGNPFFLEEIIRTLLENGVLVRDGERLRLGVTVDAEQVERLIGLPGNVQALLTARIDRLPKDARQVLQHAAVIGRSFPSRLLQQIGDQNGALEGHLKQLEQAELIRQTASAPEIEYVFNHALTRDAAYETILLRQRRLFHRRVGEAIEQLYPDRQTEEASRLAYHFAEGRVPDKAIRYFTLAGDEAARLYANAEAIEHYTQAIELALSPVASGLDDDGLAQLFLRRGRVYEVCGDYDRALDNYQQLERLGRERGNPRLEVAGLTPQATIHVVPTSRVDAARGEAVARRVLELSAALDYPEATARAYWSLMLLHINLIPDVEKAVAYGEQALQLARAYNLRETLAYVLNDITRAYAAAGRMDDSMAAFAEAKKLWEELGNIHMLTDLLGMNAQGMLIYGEVQQSVVLALEGLELSRRIDNLWGQSLNSYSLGAALLEKGRISEGLSLMKQSIGLAGEANFSGPQLTVALAVLWTYGKLGRPDHDPALVAMLSAEEIQEQWTAMLPEYAALWRLLNRFFAGDYAGAADAAEGLEQRLNMVQAGIDAPWVLAVMAELNLKAERPERTLELTDLSDRLATRYGVRAFYADALEMRGRALLKLGRRDEALETLRAARAECERQGARLSLWSILAALAEAEPDPAAAAELRAEAQRQVRYLIAQIDEPELRRSFSALPDVAGLLAAGLPAE